MIIDTNVLVRARFASCRVVEFAVAQAVKKAVMQDI